MLSFGAMMPAVLPEPAQVPPGARETGRRRQIRHSRRAWQSLLWGVLAFAGLQIFLTSAAESWLPAIRDPLFWAKLPRFQKRLSTANSKPWTVVMFGSSCTIHGFRGLVFEEELGVIAGRKAVTCNFGVYGRGPLTQLINLKRLLRAGIRPDLVLVEVFPTLVLGPVSMQEKQGALMQQSDLATLATYHSPGVAEKEWLQAALVPVTGNRQTILAGLAPRLLRSGARPDWWQNADASGWLANIHAGFDDPEAERCRTQWREQIKKLRRGGQAERALDELLALGRREGLPLALVIVPEGPTLRSLYTDAAYHLFRGLVTELSERHGVPVCDARTWLDEEDFSDSYHPLEHGAAKFTTRLARDFVGPLLRQRSVQ